MKTIRVDVLVELVEKFGLKKRHAQKLTLYAVHRKEWALTKQMDITEGTSTVEEVIVEFLKKEKKTVISDETPTFKNEATQELYNLVVEELV